MIQNTGTAPLTEVTLTATPPTDWTVTTDPETLPAIPPGETATITATITPSGEAVAGDYVVTFNAKAAKSGADGHRPDPVHRRDVSAVGARRPRPDRPDPGRPVLRVPDLRAAMSSSTGRIAPKRRPGRRLAAAPSAATGAPTGIDAPSDTIRIRTRGLTKRYDDLVAVDHLDLDVHAGEIFGLLGQNGAGKTTTILMLLGLTEPTGGSARVVGLDPSRGPLEVKRRVGYMPDSVGFYGDLTGRENLRYTARLNRLPRDLSGRRRSTRSSTRSACPTEPTTGPTRTRAACSSGSASPMRS